MIKGEKKMKKYRWRKRSLVHITIFALELLIAATVITSTAVPEIMQTAKPIKVTDKEANAVRLASPTLVTSRLQGNTISEENLQMGELLPSDSRDIIWNNSLPDGASRLSFGIWTGFNRELVDEFTITSPQILQGGSF